MVFKPSLALLISVDTFRPVESTYAYWVPPLWNARAPPAEFSVKVPVLFEAPVAASLLSALVQATSGGALYRRATFLADSLDKMVMAPTPKEREALEWEEENAEFLEMDMNYGKSTMTGY